MIWLDIVVAVWILVFISACAILPVWMWKATKIKRLLMRYGSVKVPDAKIFANTNTPDSTIRFCRYVLTKTYEEEVQPDLREAGRSGRQALLTGLFLLFAGGMLTIAILASQLR